MNNKRSFTNYCPSCEEPMEDWGVHADEPDWTCVNPECIDSPFYEEEPPQEEKEDEDE